MRVFVTGATGFLGSHIVSELLTAGHQVLGLTRSEAGRRRLEQTGAVAYYGTLDAPDTVARGAAAADAVIHTGFDHDFTRFAANCEQDRRVIDAMAGELAGTDRPLIITSVAGLGKRAPDALAVESFFDRDSRNPRRLTEIAVEAALENGTSVAVVRLPQVHDTEQQGLITPAIALARRAGVSAYIGDGANRWSAAPVRAVAQLYRLALERHERGARWHAVAEEGVPMRAIAEVVGERLGVPVQSLAPADATAHFGWLDLFMSADHSASSARTRELLEWTPEGPGLLDDLRALSAV